MQMGIISGPWRFSRQFSLGSRVPDHPEHILDVQKRTDRWTDKASNRDAGMHLENEQDKSFEDRKTEKSFFGHPLYTQNEAR